MRKLHLPLQVSVRRAKIEDAAAMSRVIRETLYSTNANDYPAPILAGMAARAAPTHLRRHIREDFAVVAELEGWLVGTGMLVGNEIRKLYVLARVQGHGVGRRIMQQLEEEARRRGLPDVILHSSLTARGFYRQLGYVPIHYVEREVGGRALLMVKLLGQPAMVRKQEV